MQHCKQEGSSGCGIDKRRTYKKTKKRQKRSVISYICDKVNERSLERNEVKFDLNHQAWEKQINRQAKICPFSPHPLFCYLLVVTWLENNSSSSPCTGQTHVDKRTHILTKTREKLPSPAATSVHTGIQTEPSSQQHPARETEKGQCAYRSSQERRKFFTSNSVTTGIIWAWIYCILLWRHHCCSEQEYLYSLFTF